jgi:hypothetical protein
VDEELGTSVVLASLDLLLLSALKAQVAMGGVSEIAQ